MYSILLLSITSACIAKEQLGVLRRTVGEGDGNTWTNLCELQAAEIHTACVIHEYLLCTISDPGKFQRAAGEYGRRLALLAGSWR